MNKTLPVHEFTRDQWKTEAKKKHSSGNKIEDKLLSKALAAHAKWWMNGQSVYTCSGNGFFFTCVNGNCSELAPHSQTLCSTTRMANLWWATHWAWLQSSISSGDKCEWTRCSSNSKHSAASPKQPNGKRRPANGPLASALRNASGHSAGSELVCNCWNNSWKKFKTKINFIVFDSLAEPRLSTEWKWMLQNRWVPKLIKNWI